MMSQKETQAKEQLLKPSLASGSFSFPGEILVLFYPSHFLFHLLWYQEQLFSDMVWNSFYSSLPLAVAEHEKTAAFHSDT